MDIKNHFLNHQLIADSFLNNDNNFDSIKQAADLMLGAINTGGTIFSCGNGGSSAISEHFVCDFLKGASTDTSIQPIIHSFTSNIPTLTAVANDIDYEEIFSYQLRKYAKDGEFGEFTLQKPPSAEPRSLSSSEAPFRPSSP